MKALHHIDLSVLEFHGTAEAMGRHHGEALASRIRFVVQELVYKVEERVGITLADLRKTAARSTACLAEDYIHEMEGVAHGACVDYEDILALNCLMDAEASDTTESAHCHNVIIHNSASGYQEIMHGRNLDFTDTEVAPIAANVFIRHPANVSRNSTVAVAWAGHVGILTGMNMRGISVGEVTSYAPPRNIPGTPISLLLRESLEIGHDLNSVMKVIGRRRPMAGFNIAICDGNRQQACAVELLPDIFSKRGMFRGVLVVDDPCLTKEMLPFRVCLPSGAFRHARMVQLVEENRGTIDVSKLMSFLTDRYDLGYGVKKGRLANNICNPHTIQSVLFIPRLRKLYISHTSVPAPLGEYHLLELVSESSIT